MNFKVHSTDIPETKNKNINILSLRNIGIFISILSPLIFIVYVLIFLPIFLEFLGVSQIEWQREYEAFYLPKAATIFSFLIASSILSVSGLVLAFSMKMERIGLMNFIIFLLTLISLFITILVLSPD